LGVALGPVTIVVVLVVPVGLLTVTCTEAGTALRACLITVAAYILRLHTNGKTDAPLACAPSPKVHA